jgi:hypothetical protein
MSKSPILVDHHTMALVYLAVPFYFDDLNAETNRFTTAPEIATIVLPQIAFLGARAVTTIRSFVKRRSVLRRSLHS